jgi:Methyltransferase domain
VQDVVDEGWADRVREQARSQWGHDPAGGLVAGDDGLGSAESFARVDAYRRREQPWMDATFRWERFRGTRVLEIGVGLGTDHLQLGRAGAVLSGVDLTPRCVELTARRFEQEQLRTDLYVMDAEQLTFPDDSFDVVYARVVLGWALSLRFLRQDFSDLLADIEYSTSTARPHVRLFGREELREILVASGFECVAIRRRHVGVDGLTAYIPDAVQRALGRVGGWYLVHESR